MRVICDDGECAAEFRAISESELKQKCNPTREADHVRTIPRDFRCIRILIAIFRSYASPWAPLHTVVQGD